jgi:hypothetical protein
VKSQRSSECRSVCMCTSVSRHAKATEPRGINETRA